MAYDALGNYVPDSPNASIDDMRYYLARHPAPAQQSVVAQAAPEKRPLDKATDMFKQIALDFNPLMMMRTLTDAPKIVSNTLAAPLASMWSVPFQGMQNKGAEFLHRLTGDEQSAQEAAARNTNIQPSNFQLPLQSTTGQMAQEGLVKAFDESKLAGAIGMPRIPSRGFTPNDLRVAAANAQRIGKQVKELPTDIANARAGITKIDPVTGQSTLGAKVQPVVDAPVKAGMKAERALDPIVQDIMNRGGYSADVLAAMAGQPSYAVRKPGGIVPRPEVPDTVDTSELKSNPLTALISSLKVVPDEPTVGEVTQVYKDALITSDEKANQFLDFYNKKLEEEFPTLDKEDRNRALAVKYGKPSARSQWERNTLNEFIAQQNDPSLPTMEEFANRVDKAHNWLEGPFVRDFTQYAGTAEDPKLALAAQGHTFIDPEKLYNAAETYDDNTIGQRREAAGFSSLGQFQPQIMDLRDNRSALDTNYQSRLNAQQDEYLRLQAQGMPDPYQDPGLAKFKAANEKIGKKIADIDKQISNLTVGRSYETLSDASVVGRPANLAFGAIDASEQQFYPSLERTARETPDQTVYSMYRGPALELGMKKLGKDYVNDILTGKVDPANTSIPAYIKRTSEARIKAKEAEKAALEERKLNIISALRMQLKTTPGKQYGNAIAIVIDNSLPPETIRKLLSADCEVLDHCIGDIGGKPVGIKNLIKNPNIKRERYPMYDLATGQLMRSDARPSSYMNAAARGEDKYISLRTADNGIPEATIQFSNPYLDASGKKTYTLGYVSGFHNGTIDPTYRNALRDVLNDHADEIRDSADRPENSGVYDKDNAHYRSLTTRDNWEAVKDSLPRFFTKEDLKAEVAKIQKVATSQLAAASPAEISAIQDDVASAIETTIATAGAEYANRELYREVDARLRDAYGLWAQQFPDNVFAQDPLRAVTHLQGRLDNMANSVPVALRGAFAEARDNVTAVLQGMQVPRQQAAQQPRQIDVNALLNDVNVAMDNAIVTAMDNDPNMTEPDASVLNGIIQRNVDNWRNEQSIDEFSTNPIMHLDRLMGYAAQAAGDGNFAESIRDAYANLLDELTAVRDSYTRQPQAPVPQPPGQVDANAMLSDVNTAMDNAIAFAINDPNMPASMVPIIDMGIRRIIDYWRNEQSVGELSTNPIMHLDRLITRAENAATDRGRSESLRNAHANLVDELRAVRGSYAPQAQAQAQAPAPQAPAPARDRTLALWLNDEIARISEADGLDVVSSVWEAITPIRREVDIDTQPELYAYRLREAATLAQNALVEENLNAIAGYIVANRAAPQAPARFDVGPIIMATREAAQRDLTPDQWNTISSLLERANNIADARQQPQGFADTISDLMTLPSVTRLAGFDDQTARRLTGLVDNITNGLTEFNRQQAPADLGEPADLGAWEVDDQHGANQPTPSSVARQLIEIEREPDGTLRATGIASTVQALRTGQLDHPSLTMYPPGGQLRIQAGEPIATYVIHMSAPELSYTDLQQQLTDTQRGQINNDSARIIRQARAFGIDWPEVESMVRRRSNNFGNANVNLDLYGPVALEVLARDVRDALAIQPDAPRAGPAPQRNTHDLYIELNEALQNAQDEGSIELQHMPDEAIAQLIENDEIGGFDDLTDVERQSLAQYIRDNGIREPNNPARQAPAVGRPLHVTQTNRGDADAIFSTITETMDDGQLSMQDRVDEFDGYLDVLSRGVEGLEDIVPQPFEEWNNPEGLRFELMRRFQQERDSLQQMIEEEGDDEEPQHFAKGGRVTHIPTTDDMHYELMMRRA
jgi:hypothetical protein